MPDPSDKSNIAVSILKEHATTELPLTRRENCRKPTAEALMKIPAEQLFPGSKMPKAALSGLLLLLDCWEESHQVSQELDTREGSYWHAIAHRMEPDAANASYWFRRVGVHPIFPELRERAVQTLSQYSGSVWHVPSAWDPFTFIRWCDEARVSPGTPQEKVALEIQRAEWDLLYSWCLR